MVRKIVCAAAALCVGVLAPGSAGADTGDTTAPQNSPPKATDGWQAGTCTTPVCDPGTDAQFYTQASGHPPFGFTQFIVKHTTVVLLETPVGTLKDVRVDLPIELSVNPQATAQCELATFEAGAAGCPVDSIVGESIVTTSAGGGVAPPLPFQGCQLLP